MNPISQVCTQCKQEKTINNFRKKIRKGVYKGYHTWCNDCKNAYTRAYYQKNRVQILAFIKHITKTDGDGIRAKSRAYDLKRRQQMIATDK